MTRLHTLHWKPRFAARALQLGYLLITSLYMTGCTSIEQLTAGATITPPPPGPTWIEPAMDVPEFSLLDQNGQPFTLENLEGKPSLFYFGYTFCPDVCPLTLAEMGQVAALLEDSAQDINLVFVSVDFQRDTPARLQQYLPAFNARIIGLTTNDETQLQQITQAFGVFYELEEPAGTEASYLVAHTSSTFLMDANGQIRVKFAYRTPPPVIAEVIEQILRESGDRPD